MVLTVQSSLTDGAVKFFESKGKRNIVRTQVQTLSFLPLTTKVWGEVWREGNRHQ